MGTWTGYPDLSAEFAEYSLGISAVNSVGSGQFRGGCWIQESAKQRPFREIMPVGGLGTALHPIRATRMANEVKKSTELFRVLKRRFLGHEAQYIIKRIEKMAGTRVPANFQGGLKGPCAELKAQTARDNRLLWLVGGIGTVPLDMFGHLI